jgi:hypothetical protein
VVWRVDLSTGLIYTWRAPAQIGFTGDGGDRRLARNSTSRQVSRSAAAWCILRTRGTTRSQGCDNIINTVAGTGIRDNGPAVNAFLNFPEGIAIDGSGDILVADTGNAEAREFKAGGNINSVGQLQGGEPLERHRGSGRKLLCHRRGAKLSQRECRIS